MNTSKKILIAALGAPAEYSPIDWHFASQVIKTPIGFALLAAKLEVDQIFLLGTEQSFDQKRKHYRQYRQALEEFGLIDKTKEEIISPLINRDQFWTTFEKIVQNPLFRKDKIESYLDLTFGYRIQPMLIFLVAYFLQETKPDIKLKKIYYCMEKASPPQIVDMTELVYLLDWLKSIQIFIHGGSAQSLIKSIKSIAYENFPHFVEAFEDFTNAYAFNYVSHLNIKSQKFLQLKEEKQFLRSNYPVYHQIELFINNFIKIFKRQDQLSIQIELAKKNFQEGAYARSVLILREYFITMFCQVLFPKKRKNEIRGDIEDLLINRLYFALYSPEHHLNLADEEKDEAEKTRDILLEVVSEKDLNQFYKLWGEIRSIRNGIAHIKNYNKNEKINFIELKEDVHQMLIESEELIQRLFNQLKSAQGFRQKIKALLKKSNKKNRLFIIVNEGIHPILPALKKQYGSDIKYFVLTSGNVGLDQERQIAQKCREIAEKYHDYIIPGGFSYLSTTANNVFQ